MTNIPWALRLCWIENVYMCPLLSAGDFHPQTTSDLPSFWCVWSGSLVGPYMQDHKSLCAAVTICWTLVYKT